MPKVAGTMIIQSSSAQANPGRTIKVYDLGYYPGGTWSEPRGINDFGVVVAFGDIASGYTRPIGVPLFGPKAFQWFDLGTLGGDRTDTEVMCMGVADTGMIVGHSAIPGNEIVHAFAWTPKSGIVDIGALGDDHSFSLAYNVNKSGTLIVGWSSSEFMGPESLPVVWTPKVMWGRHGPAITWKIQKLDTTGFEGANSWYATAVNDFGQIIGTATTADGFQIAVLWNPLPGGKEWKIMQLPVPPDDPNAAPSDINNKGEIVGYFEAADLSVSFPALWKPMVPRRSVYDVTRLTTLTGSEQGWAEANGINDVGDIVGDSYDANWNWFATRYSTQDPSFIKVLGFPGTWSWAYRVNNNHIAVGSYGSDTIPENTAAVKFK
ncbi:MAG: hypothetical protein ABSG73_13280 [Candidatus Aminicenantales bacterium]|jgi:probable HAF family extracellular repeat protein